MIGCLRVNRPRLKRCSSGWKIPERLRRLVFDSQKLKRWDSGLLIFLLNLRNYSANQNITLNSDGLPEGAKKLLELAAAVPEKKDARKAEERQSFLLMLGNQTVEFFQSAGELLTFIGDAVIAVLRLLRGQAQFRRTDLGLILQAASIQLCPSSLLSVFW